MSGGTEITIVLLCLLAGWFFAGMETGMISINRLRLRHLVRRRVPGAETIQGFLQNPDRLLGTTLVGTNISYTVASTLAVSLGFRLFGPRGSMAASVLITLVILTFCEYFSKAWFQSFPAGRTLPFAPILKYAGWVLLPLRTPLMFVARLLVPVRLDERRRSPVFVTREEIIHLATEGKTSGILTPAEHRMIHEVIQLKTKTCREIMTPLERMVVVDHDTPVPELLELARNRVLNRLPVYDREKKSYTGVVHVFDVLSDEHSEGKTAGDYARPAQLVADYTPVDHVLPRMRVTRQHMVIVTDERFEVIGLVTLEDVLDELVGAL
ncbi:MAG: DUF21 domain-containing protein [Kiritimatiellae bacterium]|nr:DUF21 domain-containing protein [Kiritimatiellia bacterium]